MTTRDEQIWEDIKRLRRLADVGATAMGDGYDAVPFTEDLPLAAEKAWGRLRDRFEPGASPTHHAETIRATGVTDCGKTSGPVTSDWDKTTCPACWLARHAKAVPGSCPRCETSGLVSKSVVVTQCGCGYECHGKT